MYESVETPMHPWARAIFNVHGLHWVAPAGVSSVNVQCYGGGGSAGSGGGGGGAYAPEPRFDPYGSNGGGGGSYAGAVVGVGDSGRVYHFAAGSGGCGGSGSSAQGSGGGDGGAGSGNVIRRS